MIKRKTDFWTTAVTWYYAILLTVIVFCTIIDYIL
jgi:hypothetical protein